MPREGSAGTEGVLQCVMWENLEVRQIVRAIIGLIENDPVGKLAVIKFGMDQGCSNCAGCGKVECMSQV